MHVVICPGHAVYLGGDVFSDSSWVLQPFQAAEPRYYVDHLRAAVELTAAEAGSTLILSGGLTRGAGKSEALGYYEVAERLHWFNYPDVRGRAILEEKSRDSFENLLFSIRLLSEVPHFVTVAGWAFKEQRFQFHRETIDYPADRFRYIGVNNPPDLEAALVGEERAVAEFRKDPWGTGSVLGAKRVARGG